MQTSTEATVRLAGQQIPLLREDQIVPGAIVTGVGMTHAWQILRRTGDRLEIVKLPNTAQIQCAPDSHVMETFGHGQVCSRCQIRRQPVADFLPRVADKPRVHVIVPSGPLMPGLPYTLYGYMIGDALQTVSMTGAVWSTELPLIPALEVLWTLPETLRSLTEGLPVASEDQSDND